MSDANRALIDYWAGVPLRAEGTSGAKRCDWMVTIRDASQNRNLEVSGWIIAAEMRRPSERSERFILYRRAR